MWVIRPDVAFQDHAYKNNIFNKKSCKMNPCSKEEVIDIIREDLKQIKGDVSELVKFKTQAMTIIAIISGAVTMLYNLILK